MVGSSQYSKKTDPVKFVLLPLGLSVVQIRWLPGRMRKPLLSISVEFP